MVIYITGGSGSGKSAFAEELIEKSEIRERTYIATMRTWDEEGEKRVERHREMRRDKGFFTLECAQNLASAAGIRGAVLLEDLTNLFTNEWYGDSRETAVLRITDALHAIAESAQLFVIVGNSIFSDGIDYGSELNEYLYELGKLNREAAAMADKAYEVVNGIEQPLLGKMAAGGSKMTLIVGGKYQGKLDHIRRTKGTDIVIACDPQTAQTADVFYALEAWLRREKEPWSGLGELIRKNPDIIIVCDEVGCGVVPVDAAEREWRECVGRITTELAARAGTVIRLVSGIPIVLKEETVC